MSKSSHYFGSLAFVFLMSFGYMPLDEDSTSLAFGVHGGYGQVASVLRDCSGRVLHAEGSSFSDVSGSAYYKALPVVIGIKVGHWSSSAGFSRSDGQGLFSRSPDRDVNFTYINPSISIEHRNVGVGLGYISGEVPLNFRSFKVPAESFDKVRISAHLRFGNREKGYVAASFGENTPLISGGGLFVIGMGYPAGKSVRLFSGLSVGFYDREGFLQRGAIQVSDNVYLDITARLASSGGVSESSISGGLIYHIGTGARKTKGQPDEFR